MNYVIKEVNSQPENPFSKLVPNQKIVEIKEYQLESDDIIYDVPVAYKTWGKLNAEGNNCMVICHALTGSSDVSDWWGPLLGKNKLFDPSRYFIICLNSLGSPYGSASPVTKDPETGELYGPEFPLTTVRDDVNIHKVVLDYLGVKQVAIVVGGSMGGMLALEWCFLGKEYVKSCVACATSARNSAWCISWNEAQRQCIYSDPKYDDGYYPLSDPPSNGLSAARMSAMLTYRSRNSFERKFGRNEGSRKSKLEVLTDTPDESAIESSHWSIHNDGLRTPQQRGSRRTSSLDGNSRRSSMESLTTLVSQTSLSPPGGTSSRQRNKSRAPHFFSAQSYLRYQGEKFLKRFDANCYIAITRKLDTHDLARDRDFDNSIEKALNSIEQPTLVVGITSDGLFTFSEQQLLAKHIPNSEFHKIDSPEGHDAFLLEFAEMNNLLLKFENEHLTELMSAEVEESEDLDTNDDMTVTKDSVFGEAELDITQW